MGMPGVTTEAAYRAISKLATDTETLNIETFERLVAANPSTQSAHA